MPTTVPPSAAVLRQFRLGLLPSEQAEAVEKWLTETPSAADELSRVVARDPVTDALCETLTAPPADTSVVPLAQPPTAADVPPAVGGFRVIRELGRGGMGVVLEAEDSRLGRRVAVKLIGAGAAADDTARVRFQQEARAVAGIEHDNVVPVHQVGEDAGRPFLVMPLLRGETLHARLRRDGRLVAAEVARIGRDVALGLAAAHAVGLVHRDVKPANVWLDADTGRARLLDFGLAKPLAPADDGAGPRTHAGAVIGTPHYMAPEQAEGRPVDHRADLFSLGALLYHAATGVRPFSGDTMWQVLHAVTADTPVPPELLIPGLPPTLTQLIRALLAKSSIDRPASAASVAEALARPDDVPMPWAALGDTTEVTSVPPGRQPVPKRPVSRRAVVALAAGLLVALGGAVYQFEFATKDGTLFVEVDGDVDARFKNGELQIFDSAGKLKYTLKPGQRDAKMPAGAYAVKVLGADGVVLDTPEFTMTKDGRATVRVTARASAAAPAPAWRPSVPIPAEEAAIDRKAAEWVLTLGGTVQVNGWGYWVGAADLPAGPFRLTGVNLFRNERLTDEGLSNLANCRNLTNLELSLTSVGDRGVAHLRGLKGLTHLQMYGTRVTDRGVADVAPLTGLVSLNVAMTGVTDAGLAPFKGRTGFVFLDLGGTKVTDVGLAHFKDCKNLRHLNLNLTPVTDDGVRPLAACADLEILHLHGTRVTDAGLTTFKTCTALKHVVLAETAVTDAGLIHLQACPKLANLELAGTRISDAGLAHLGGYRSLARLVLNGTRISDAGLAQLGACKSLTWLELDGTRTTDAGFVLLAGRDRLETLYLRRTEVTAKKVEEIKRLYPRCWIERDAGTVMPPTPFERAAAEAVLALGGTIRFNDPTRDIRAVADLPPRGGVNALELRGNPKVTDDALAPFANCRGVLHIGLSGTAVGDTGLAAFRGCVRLRTLDLTDTRVTVKGLAALDGFADLTHVRLTGTTVDDAALTRLKDCTQLVYLDVRRTKVTAAALAAFAAARPRCRIEWDGGIAGPKE